jgi:hypothetical protein
MEPFDPAKAFQQIRAESQRAKEAAEEPSRLKQEAWDAFGRGRAPFQQLMSLFPPENEGCTWDGARAAALMVKYAQTLGVEWVKARVEFVRERLAKLAADGRPVQGADFKEILLNLLLFAHAGDEAKVAEIFNEAMRGDANEVGFFRWCLVNWLVDKVVDGWPPLPDELQPLRATSDEVLEEEAPLDRRVAPTGGGNGNTDGAGPASMEEWLPASKAAERAEQCGHPIPLKCLTKDACKHGVRIRPRQQAGKHRREVEWSSLAGYLLKRDQLEPGLDEEATNQRIRETRAQKRRERSLD